MKLCVFPNDPLIRYFEKGEIKERYFNPKNIFGEIHIISFIDKDVEVERAQILFGSARIFIYSVGKISFLNKNKKRDKVLEIVEKIKPDIIRSYNTLLCGWVAAYCSDKLKIPFFVSIHVQYDGLRKIIKKSNYKKYLALSYSQKKIEPYVLSKANKITAVYRIIEPYVIKHCGKSPEILYNRVELDRFRKGEKILDYEKPLIITVGRLTPQKNPHILIKAMKNLDAYLMVIGDGELRNSLEELIKEMKLEGKIIFKKSVPNNMIQNFYKSADVFALAYNAEIEGVPIPVLEAMATGVPCVIPKPIKGLSDGLENAVCFADLNPESFSTEIKKILSDPELAKTLSKNALEKSKEFDGVIIEKKEAEIYKTLFYSNNTEHN